MRIPFSLYDFLGYAVPGFIVTVILVILINPVLLVNLSDQLKDKNSDLAQILRPTVTQGILYILLCYLIGLASHALTHWLFGVFSRIWAPLKRYYADSGIFEEALFDPKCRIYPEDFEQYTAQFLCKLKCKFKDVFKMDLCEIGETKGDSPVAYTEIFNLCRTIVLRHSEASAGRTSALLALYNSARLLGSILFLGSVSFWVRIVFYGNLLQGTWVLFIVCFSVFMSIWIMEHTICLSQQFLFWLIYWIVILVLGSTALLKDGFSFLLICYCISAVLCPIFFHLYHVLFRYYRNTILYGFYEYAVTQEKSRELKNSKN
jgi:hypothetical protein